MGQLSCWYNFDAPVLQAKRAEQLAHDEHAALRVENEAVQQRLEDAAAGRMEAAKLEQALQAKDDEVRQLAEANAALIADNAAQVSSLHSVSSVSPLGPHSFVRLIQKTCVTGICIRFSCGLSVGCACVTIGARGAD